jgi:hypothetical protein
MTDVLHAEGNARVFVEDVKGKRVTWACGNGHLESIKIEGDLFEIPRVPLSEALACWQASSLQEVAHAIETKTGNTVTRVVHWPAWRQYPESMGVALVGA